MIRRLNVPVASEALFSQLAGARRPLGMAASRPTYALLRETYFDTRDGALRERKMRLKLRAEAGGRLALELSIGEAVNLQGVVEETVLETPVVGGGLYATLAGSSELANRITSVVDPIALRPRVALDIDRETRDLKARWLGRATHRLTLDQIVAHGPHATRALQEVSLTELERGGRVGLETLVRRLSGQHGIETDGMDSYERARTALAASPDVPRGDAPQEVRLALVILRGREIALVDRPAGMALPSTRGSGEEVARAYLSELTGRVGQGALPDLDLVGFAPVRAGADVEVWLHGLDEAAAPSGLVWLPLMELLERVGGPRLESPDLVAPLLLLVRSELGMRLLREAPIDRGPPTLLAPGSRRGEAAPGEGPDDYLDLDLSVLDFNQRVLELAEDPDVPLLERFRFLSIFASNTDEFFVVRVGRLKEQVGSAVGADHALSPAHLLDLIAIRTRALIARQYASLRRVLLPELASRGSRVRAWSDLAVAEAADLSQRFSEEIFPLLTPLSLSTSPGRSFPRLVSLGLAVVAVLRRAGESRTELGYVPVPDTLPRFLPVPGTRDVVLVEEVIRANAGRLFPSCAVEGVYAFRASRVGDVEIDEDHASSLLATVADEVEGRAYKPVIRLEVEASLPREVRAYLLRELRAEQSGVGATLTRSDIYEVPAPLDLRGLSELARLDVEGGVYPAFEPRRPLADARSVFEVLAERDLLVHHPYDSFEDTVGRLLDEAATDPAVVAVKLTLYRTGRRSPVMDALLEALARGKEVSVFVELKARFDEESNIEWTHRLAAAGARVVYGVVGYKTHAKTALIVRRERDRVRRYVHIGTGNYNASTARFYTDFGLMSSDPDLGADLNDFFNELTGSEGPPQTDFRRLLVAPSSLVQGLETMIRREIDHARTGRAARIQAKLNGLADREIVDLLYEASRAGVGIDLVVRSICTLRPGVPGLSTGIQVRSILGRFLEHGRIYYFENGGVGDYFIGSADWRARNLRRRVEVVAPVDDQEGRALLRSVLDAQLSDPRAWVLRPDGVFERREGDGATSQEVMLQAVCGAVPAPR